MKRPFKKIILPVGFVLGQDAKIWSSVNAAIIWINSRANKVVEVRKDLFCYEATKENDPEKRTFSVFHFLGKAAAIHMSWEDNLGQHGRFLTEEDVNYFDNKQNLQEGAQKEFFDKPSKVKGYSPGMGA